METYLGAQAITGIFVHLIFIVITWWALQGLDLSKIFKKGKTAQIQMTYVLLTISIAYLVSNFFIQYLNFAQQLPNLFK